MCSGCYERSEKALQAGWQQCLDSVRASLQDYPMAGGDVEIMREVERIAREAVRMDSTLPFLAYYVPCCGATVGLMCVGQCVECLHCCVSWRRGSGFWESL